MSLTMLNVRPAEPLPSPGPSAEVIAIRPASTDAPITVSLGDMAIGSWPPNGLDALRRSLLVNDDLFLLLFIPAPCRIGLAGDVLIDCEAGDLVAAPMRWMLDGSQHMVRPCMAVLASHRFLTGALPSRSPIVALRRSPAIEALRRHVERLYRLGPGAFTAEQAIFAGRGVRELLAAAAVPVAIAARRGTRREDALFDRLINHIDAHLRTDITVTSLCDALGCSRSALYRAAAPAGGLVELVVRRRLTAVHVVLRRPDEHRPIAEIARDHGFPDSSQFSRRFRRAFGVSAGRLRAQDPGPEPVSNPVLRVKQDRVRPAPEGRLAPVRR